MSANAAHTCRGYVLRVISTDRITVHSGAVAPMACEKETWMYCSAAFPQHTLTTKTRLSCVTERAVRRESRIFGGSGRRRSVIALSTKQASMCSSVSSAE